MPVLNLWGALLINVLLMLYRCLFSFYLLLSLLILYLLLGHSLPSLGVLFVFEILEVILSLEVVYLFVSQEISSLIDF